MAIARRAVDRHAASLQPRAGFVDVVDAVGEVTESRFMLHLIPETLKLTNLGQCQVGDELNIEIDSQTQAIVDTVERVLAKRFSDQY